MKKILITTIFSMILIITNIIFIGGQLELTPVLRNVTLTEDEEIYDTSIEEIVLLEDELIGYKNRWGVVCYKNND